MCKAVKTELRIPPLHIKICFKKTPLQRLHPTVMCDIRCMSFLSFLGLLLLTSSPVSVGL